MAKRLKLLIATDTFFPKKDGVTIFLNEIIPRLQDFYDITILAPSYTKVCMEDMFHEAKVFKFPTSSKITIEGYPMVVPRLQKIRQHVSEADIVWVHSAAPLGMTVMYIAKRLKKPLAASIHAIEWEQLAHTTIKYRAVKRLIMWFAKKLANVYNKCDVLFISSKYVGEELRKAGIKTRKAIVHLGVEHDRFIPPQDKSEAKRRINIDPSFTVIGYAGRISKEKDLPTLCTAFAKLQKIHKKIFLLIVGDGTRDTIKDIVKRNYQITGFVDDVVPYLQAMDIFVMPSLTETTSLATMEAMSCGLAVIATPVGHIKEYVENGFNGYTFPPENRYILEHKLERLIRKPEIRPVFGRLARKTIVTKYSWEKTALKIDKVMRGMV